MRLCIPTVRRSAAMTACILLMSLLLIEKPRIAAATRTARRAAFYSINPSQQIQQQEPVQSASNRFTGKSECTRVTRRVAAILQVPRGGSNTSKSPPSNQLKGEMTNKKSKKSSSSSQSTRSRRKSTKKADDTTSNAADLFRLIPISSSNNRNANAATTTSSTVQIEALLTHRKMPWRFCLQLLLALWTLWNLHHCVSSAGVPRRMAIWSILQHLHYDKAETTPPTPRIMPRDFVPTPLETFLAKFVAEHPYPSVLLPPQSQNLDLYIPPAAMPQQRPLMTLILSLLTWIVGTILLPHWFLRVQLWFDYTTTTTTTNVNDNDKPTAVLIQTRPTTTGTTTTKHRKSATKSTICQLYQTPLRSQMEHGVPAYYFEYGHQRYYCDDTMSSLSSWQGGPNLQVSVGNLTRAATRSDRKTRSSNSNNTTTTIRNKYVGLLQAPSQLVRAHDRWYPYNHQTTVPIPTITQALWGRLKSPLVVVQLIGKAMTALEEGRLALVSLVTTVYQHYENARQSILTSKTLQQDVAGLAEEFATAPVWIYRGGSWKSMVASDILPGDVFLLTMADTTSSTVSASSSIAKTKKGTRKQDTATTDNHKQRQVVIPVDALLLDGLCVTMEAVLTGETVPQTKMPIDSTTPEWNQTLDMTGTHRTAVLFAGTSLLHCVPPPPPPSSSSSSSSSKQKRSKGPPPGVPCLALRTGSYSSKGELITALTLSRAKGDVATISNPQFDQDALKLITTMSFVSFLACASLFLSSSGRKISGFQRIIQCTRIATCCIPSDLPLALSFVTQLCSNELRKEGDVVCSQPGALLTASQIDTVVFDKTGTLTADTQSLAKIVKFKNAKSTQNDKKSKEVQTRSKDFSQVAHLLVLAGCHSLVSVQLEYLSQNKTTSKQQATASLVGDPLELAALQSSGWKYNTKEDYYYPTSATAKSSHVEKLWQIKVFPFSPSARLSSALCLTRHSDGKFKLWAMVKGAPEAVHPLLTGENMASGVGSIDSWYPRKVQSLETKGFRVLAMGIREVSSFNFTAVADNEQDLEKEKIAEANRFATNVHRSDLEGCTVSADFCGFACFDAFVRPSSERIIGELQVANIRPIMLTGDGIRSAVSVAAKVGMIGQHSKLAVLERSPIIQGSDQTSHLQWRFTTPRSSKYRDNVANVTDETIIEILRKSKRGELAIAATGEAMVDLIQHAEKARNYKVLIENAFRFSVVARASPSCKEIFVKTLCGSGRRVLMCGDGVNDVSAMKEAEVSVALLNGFGSESGGSGSGSDKSIDNEDHRRRMRTRNKTWGKQNASKESSVLSVKISELEKQGVGSSAAAANARLRQRIEAAQGEITRRVAERHGIKLPTTQPLPYTMSDLKDMIAAFFSAVMEERRRASKLKQGGGSAATILAEEDMLMKKGANNCTFGNFEIRPGEACMASPFSCLRSSIDGVEAVLRAGVATAACALSMQQKITLSSLISCFNLSALYRDGVRSSKAMFQVEFYLYMLVYQMSYQESCKMRPRLPRSTPSFSLSLFNVSNIFSVIAQAAIHLLCTEMGILFARNARSQAPQPAETIAKQLIRPAKFQKPKMASLLRTLANSKCVKSSTKREFDFFGKPKFQPNYETNVVFVLSVLQNTLINLFFHKGKPFYPSILESRYLCRSAGLSILFCIACILETFPTLNKLLGFRPWKSVRQKILLLSLVLVDTIACAAVQGFCQLLSEKAAASTTASSNRDGATSKVDPTVSKRSVAADEEEQLLQMESKKNLKFLAALASGAIFMTIEAILKDAASKAY